MSLTRSQGWWEESWAHAWVGFDRSPGGLRERRRLAGEVHQQEDTDMSARDIFMDGFFCVKF